MAVFAINLIMCCEIGTGNERCDDHNKRMFSDLFAVFTRLWVILFILDVIFYHFIAKIVKSLKSAWKM